MENKLKEMQLKKLSGKEVVGLDSFRENKKQKIYVCLHPSNHIGEYHAHDFYEINFVYKGSCINLIEDENVIMDEGDAVIIHPSIFHCSIRIYHIFPFPYSQPFFRVFTGLPYCAGEFCNSGHAMPGISLAGA